MAVLCFPVCGKRATFDWRTRLKWKMRRFYSFPWNSVKSALFRLRKNPQRLEPLRGRIFDTMIAGGKSPFLIPLRGSQPCVSNYLFRLRPDNNQRSVIARLYISFCLFFLTSTSFFSRLKLKRCIFYSVKPYLTLILSSFSSIGYAPSQRKKNVPMAQTRSMERR